MGWASSFVQVPKFHQTTHQSSLQRGLYARDKSQVQDEGRCHSLRGEARMGLLRAATNRQADTTKELQRELQLLPGED